MVPICYGYSLKLLTSDHSEPIYEDIFRQAEVMDSEVDQNILSHKSVISDISVMFTDEQSLKPPE